MLTPLKRPVFRQLWLGMSLSYAGDRLQELAQGWLVASLTGSAMAVGGIGVLSSIGMLFMPVGGVIADQVDRRRALMVGQWLGAVVTGIMAILAFSERIVVWHIYLWALISGLVWMVVRPAYKVIVTQAVPPEEVRPAVSINSITETTAIVVMNVGGSALLGWLGLPLAFMLNAFSYLAAIFFLNRLRELSEKTVRRMRLSLKGVFMDLWDGLVYLTHSKGLLYPMLLTFMGILLTGPCTSLLAAIVKKFGGGIIQLGLLGGSASVGALLGAVFAGVKSEGDPLRTYPLWGLCAAVAVFLFVYNPLSALGMVGLACLGFLAFSQAVWNTSRVPRLAEPHYQARLQSISSMAFTLGAPIGAIWGGFAVDRFGLGALLVGAGVLAVVSVSLLILRRFK